MTGYGDIVIPGITSYHMTPHVMSHLYWTLVLPCCKIMIISECTHFLSYSAMCVQIDVPVMKGRKWYGLKKDIRPFITGTSKYPNIEGPRIRDRGH